MRLLIFMPLLLVISSCSSSSSSQVESEMLSDPQTNEEGSGLGSTPEEEPGQNVAVITMENHVDIVANVLAIFSGKLYGDVLLAAPDYSGITNNDWPEIDSDTAELITQPADIVCSNGGTVTITPETQGFHTDNLLTWNFDFDNCQDGITMLDGPISRAVYEAMHITSTGFVRDDQTTVVRYSGSFIGRSTTLQYWLTNDVDLTLESSEGTLVIENSTTDFFPDEISGGFKVQAAWTGDEEIVVRISDNLRPESDAGELEISAGSNNILVLNAGTGDAETVDITITENGVSSNFTQPWSLWADNLVFNSVSGY